MEVFYKELSFSNIRQQKAFEFITLLSEIGGFLGLLLGASVLTVCELVDYLAMRSMSKYRERRILISRKSTPYHEPPNPMQTEKSVLDKTLSL